MHHEVNKILFSLIVMMLVLYSCADGGNNLNIEISPSEKRLVDLASKTYDEIELLEIVKFNGLLNELNSKYPVECLREDNGMYRIRGKTR